MKKTIKAIANEYPGKGVYTCLKCNFTVQIKQNSESLPKCPKCRGHIYI